MSENQQLEVELGDRSYSITIGRNLRISLCESRDRFITEGRKVVALVDQGLAEKNTSQIKEFLSDIPYFEIPSGERSKSVEWLSNGWDFLASHKIDRTGVLFVLGGGVSGDLAGFLAASYLRGIEFVQVPTTLLAMVDSSVGGKTGINLSAGKNLVGAFHQPSKVFIDLDLLASLPDREFSAGMAEVIKYGMLGNFSLYKKLSDLPENLSYQNQELSSIVYQCCLDKASIVRDDERESDSKGVRALLNLGHTFAHAIEAVAGYGQYLHGEAVAIGLVCAFRLSQKLGFCGNDSESQLLTLLKGYNLPTDLKNPLPVEDLLDSMRSDKKVHKGCLRFIIMKEIGRSFIDESVDLKYITEVLKSIGAQ